MNDPNAAAGRCRVSAQLEDIGTALTSEAQLQGLGTAVVA